jgi:hypothetical protein
VGVLQWVVVRTAGVGFNLEGMSFLNKLKLIFLKKRGQEFLLQKRYGKGKKKEKKKKKKKKKRHGLMEDRDRHHMPHSTMMAGLVGLVGC